MKKTVVAILLLIGIVAGVQAASVSVHAPTSSASLPELDTRGKTSFSAVHAEAARRGIGIMLSSNMTISTATTATVPIRVVTGGKFTKSGSGTLAINGPFEAGLYQAFNGFSAGDVTGLREARPEWWGSDGIQHAIAASSSVVLSAGTYSTSALSALAPVRIKGVGRQTIISRSTGTGPIITITGPGTLMSQKMAGVEISDLTLDGGAINSNTGILLVNVLMPRVHNVYFRALDKGIEWRGVFRGVYDGLKDYVYENDVTKKLNYLIYADESVNQKTDADNTIVNCMVTAQKTHIYTKGTPTYLIDGLTISNNTFFFEGNAGKQHNIYGEYVTWGVIDSNHLFEPGQEALRCQNCSHLVVSDNNIAWPGQDTLASAITITGDDLNMNAKITISGNTIEEPSKHGIELYNIRKFSVTGNTIIDPSSTRHYSGAGSGNYLYDGVWVSGVAGVLSSGNGSIYNNRVQGFPGANSAVPYRLHRWDVYLGIYTSDITVSGLDTFDVENLGANTILSLDPDLVDDHTLGLDGVSGINLINRPSEFNMAAWTKGSDAPVAAPVVTANTTTSPVNTLTGDTIVFSAATSTLISYIEQGYFGLTTSIGTPFNASVYLRADTPTTIKIQAHTQSGPGYRAVRDVYVGTAWKRYYVPSVANEAVPYFYMRLYSNATDTKTIHAWGASLEYGRVNPNRFIGRTIYSTSTPSPAIGYWNSGDKIINTDTATKRYEGWAVTTAGYEAGAVFRAYGFMPNLITNVPTSVGEIAIDGGHSYMATGTTATTDWKRTDN